MLGPVTGARRRPARRGVGRLAAGGAACMAVLALTSGSALGATPFVQVAASRDHTCGIVSVGTVKCWGYNHSGELGNGSHTNSSGPVDVQGITTATSVAVGISSSCAVLSSGTVKCWGYNDSSGGALGDGSTTGSTTPVTVQGITTAIGVTAGEGNGGEAGGCALLSSGAVKCWWSSTSGNHLPADVPGISTATAISGSRPCARLSSGAVTCWDHNAVTGANLAPVPVQGITAASASTVRSGSQ